jgi:hypothetical protein
VAAEGLPGVGAAPPGCHGDPASGALLGREAVGGALRRVARSRPAAQPGRKAPPRGSLEAAASRAGRAPDRDQ